MDLPQYPAMDKVEKYRRHSQECIQLAENMPREAREKLVEIALLGSN
jgi:hypothetical protein